ncbi:hypothetical protein Tco_0665357 [Tanacetum coccineum]
MSTPIDFSAYVMNNLKIDNLTQEHLVGPALNLLKGTCRSRVELEYHFEEFQGRQVVPINYFINNDLGYLKGGSSSRKYTTSTIKTKAAKYNDIQGIEDMVSSLWSPIKMFTRRVVILKRVEDLQLGVKSHQKKLNITKPKTFGSDISKRTPYTAYSNPQGIIYVDNNNLRVLRIILVILPEHQSDTKVFTMTMEILPEPTSNKLCVMRTASAAAKPCQGDSLEFYLTTGKPDGNRN